MVRKKTQFSLYTNTCEHSTSYHNNNNNTVAWHRRHRRSNKARWGFRDSSHTWTVKRNWMRKKETNFTRNDRICVLWLFVFARIFGSLFQCMRVFQCVFISTNSLFFFSILRRIKGKIAWNSLPSMLIVFCLYFVSNLFSLFICHFLIRMKWSMKLRQSFVR